MYKSLLRFFPFLLLLAPFCILAEPDAGADDLTFEGQLLVTLHGANKIEIAAGNLAVARGTSAAIQEFGAQIIKDHSAADEQVLTLAAKRNVSIPAAVPSDPTLRYLSGFSGEAFDREFIQMMLDDHIKAVEMVQSAQARISNVPLSNFLKELLPTLQNHRDTAVAISRGLREQL